MKISVLTPSYNSGIYIDRAIKSVLNQDYKNFEHIVVDGGSTDNTLNILSSYKHLNWVSEKDKGQSDAMNKAFNFARGEIIVYLNADDYFLPGSFTKVIQEFNANLNTEIIVGNLVNEYDIENKHDSHISIPSVKFRQLILPFKYSYPYNPVSYFYKRNVQKQIGEFPLENHFVMDYWFILRAFKRYNVKKINYELGVFYHSGFNKTALNKTFSINKFAFNEARNFGIIWQIYFICFYIPELPKKIFMLCLNNIKYVLYLILLSKHVEYKDYLILGFKNSFRYSRNNE